MFFFARAPAPTEVGVSRKENNENIKVVGVVGLEPTTFRLRVCYSAN